jgi:O-antigen ligase
MWCVFLMPILLIGMDWNNRRLVWVQLAAGLGIALLVSRRSPMKRLLGKLALLMLPLIVIYIGAGWNSQSRIFAPISMFRSVSDGQVNSSTLYRDLENYNLMMTMRLSPVTGVGFGQQFTEIVTLPDISFFKEYRYMPHNSILGLWAFTGPVGFAGIWITVVVAVFMASRSYRFARTPEERTAAVMVLSMIVIYLAQCWGDIGFSERRTIVLVGPAIAMAGQLAFATGAWRASSKPQT